MAVICIIPALAQLVADISGVVSKHCSARVNDHGIQSVPAVNLREVRSECVFLNLREIEGFWKSDSTIEFYGVSLHVPKSFQLDAQDLRQRADLDTLSGWRLGLTLCTKAAVDAPQLLLLEEGVHAVCQRVLVFLYMQRQAEQVTVSSLKSSTLQTLHMRLH